MLRHITVSSRKMSREKNLEISVFCSRFPGKTRAARDFGHGKDRFADPLLG
jgi:hypothetical protein